MGHDLITHEQKTRILELAIKAVDADITPMEAKELEGYISTSKAMAQYYSKCMKTHLSLLEFQVLNASVRKSNRDVFDNALWQEMALHEKMAPEIDIPAEEKPRDLILLKVEKPVVERKVNKTLLWTTFISTAAFLMMIAYLTVVPYFEPVSVATVTDTMGTQAADAVFSTGDRLVNQKEFYIVPEGIANIQFDSGASIVVEAPAEFRLTSDNEMVLNKGKIFAVVPRQAEGFTVITPTSTVIDLGTEFGIDAVPDQGTELHVFSGRTQLLVSGSAPGQGLQDVTAGQARRINAAADKVETIPFDQYHFVRRIDSEINMVWTGKDTVSLTDLVMGGSGYGSSTENAFIIDPRNGAKVDIISGEYHQAANSFHRVSDSSFIDGVFIPNGNNQIVSSQGHIFTDCPETSGMYFQEVIFSKEYLYFPAIQERYMKNRRLDFCLNTLYMHSNLGITIDLNAIRRQFPGQAIDRFRTSVGTAFSDSYGVILGVEESAPSSTEFDVWISVDGRLWSQAQNVRCDNLFDLEVPLAPQDRFLSIVVTDGSAALEGLPDNHYDLCLLADPRFEMKLLN